VECYINLQRGMFCFRGWPNSSYPYKGAA